MDRKLSEARKIAMAKGIIKSPEELQISKAKNKRFAIKYDNKTINFGLWPFSGEGTFIDHRNTQLQSNWKKRHSKIKLKDGRLAYKVPGQPEYLSYNILWS
jgi:hypothetical protein